MTTSGSVDFSLTARQVITFALRKLRVLGAGQAPTGVQATDAMQELNLMLKGWQRYENLWRLTEGSVTLTANDYEYVLSPMPHKVVSVRYADGTSASPISIMGRDDYFSLTERATTGMPTQVYIDYQRTATTMFVWKALSAVTGETITYTYFRKYEDVDSLDNDIDVRQEWLEVVGFNLAARLLDDYGRTGDIATRIIGRADYLLESMLDDDREDEIRFVPEYAGYA